jgi:hypothetical protein
MFGTRQGSGDPVLPVGAHHATGETRYWIGESLEARSHFSRAAELYDLQHQHQRTLISLYGIDPLSLTVNCWAMAEPLLGAPDRAAELTSKVVAHAKALGHPYSLAFAFSVVAWACQMRFEVEEASELALAAERGNLCGALSIWSKARAKLDPLPTHHRGIALSEFREALARFFADAGD